MGHDPIGTGIIDFDKLGRAIDTLFDLDKVVLEIIREVDPLGEVKQGFEDLRKFGWKV